MTAQLIKLLCKIFPWKEIGWKEIGETFYRWTVLKTPWFRVYLHYLDAPQWHSHCHDHPWDFLAIILWGGYAEMITGKNRNHGRRIAQSTYWRPPGSFLYREATFKHNVATKVATANWSIVFVSNKKRNWKMMECTP